MIRLLTDPSELDALAGADPTLAATAASSVAAFRDEPERLRCFGEYDESGALVAAADLTSREILLLCKQSGLCEHGGFYEKDALLEQDELYEKSALSKKSGFHDGSGPLGCDERHEKNAFPKGDGLREENAPCLQNGLRLRSGPSGEMLDFLKKMIPGGHFTGIRCCGGALSVLKKEFPIFEREEAVMACSSLSGPPATEFCAEPPRRFEDVRALLAEADAEFAEGDPEAWILRVSRGVRRGQSTVWVIYDGERPVATASVLGRCGSCGVIAGVATRAEYRGRGMASCLAYLCAKELLDSGRTAWLVPSGEASARLYGALGFRPVYFQYHCKIINEEPT